jgi:polysaccharide biosynthesis/export protein
MKTLLAIGVVLTFLLAAAGVSAQTTSQAPSAQRSNNAIVPGMPMAAASAPTAGGGATALATLANLGADYKIGPNDLMDVEVFGVPDLKRTARVNAGGQISMPLIGNVLIAGLTAQQAETLIAEKYAQKYLQNPEVSVFIREFTTQRITVEGAVGRPGIYPITGSVTMLKVLALVGGGASYADLTDVALYRQGEKGEQIKQSHNVEKIRAGEMEDPVVMAEDVIVVKRDPTRTLLRDSLFRDVIDSINPFSVLVPGSK